jgi:hypothetical protein
MVRRAVARGVGLFILLGAASTLIRTSGAGGYIALWLPSPWHWVVIGLVTLIPLGLAGVILVRVLKRPGAEVATTGGVLLVAVLGASVFLAGFETGNLAVNRLVPFTSIGYAAPPSSPDFPAELSSKGDGRFEIVVANETEKTVSVWCLVEAALTESSGTIFFRDFKVGPIPAGGTKTMMGNLEGTGNGPFSGGCKLTSY